MCNWNGTETYGNVAQSSWSDDCTTFGWTCPGQHGGSSAPCWARVAQSAPVVTYWWWPTGWVCDTACGTGHPNATGWECNGSDGSINVDQSHCAGQWQTLTMWQQNGGLTSCTSNSGCCGSANGGAFYEYPWNYNNGGSVCAAGATASNGTLSGHTWGWTCTSGDNTTAAGCTAAQAPAYAWWPQGTCNPACGASTYNVTTDVCFAMYWNGPNNVTGTLLPNVSACMNGAYNTTTDAFWSWYNAGNDSCTDYSACGGASGGSIIYDYTKEGGVSGPSGPGDGTDNNSGQGGNGDTSDNGPSGGNSDGSP